MQVRHLERDPVVLVGEVALSDVRRWMEGGWEMPDQDLTISPL